MQRLSFGVCRVEIAGAICIVFGGKVVSEGRSELALLARICTLMQPPGMLYDIAAFYLEAESHDIAKEDCSECEKRRNYEYCVFDLNESFGIKESDT
jgi:hypothetical protein